MDESSGEPTFLSALVFVGLAVFSVLAVLIDMW